MIMHETEGARGNTPAITICQAVIQNPSLAEAQQQLGIENLPRLLTENRELLAAWERGRLLRRLGELAATPICQTAAAKALGLSEQEFAKTLVSDPECADIWRQGKHTLLVRVQGAVLRGAEEGKTHCLRTLERLLRAQVGATREGIDFEHLTSAELEAAAGIHRQQILRWYKSQGLPRNSDGTYNLPAVIGWLRKSETKKLRQKRHPKPSHVATRIVARIQRIVHEELLLSGSLTSLPGVREDPPASVGDVSPNRAVSARSEAGEGQPA